MSENRIPDWITASVDIWTACRPIEGQHEPAAMAKAYLTLAGEMIGKLPAWKRRGWYENLPWLVEMSAEDQAKRLGTDVNDASVTGEQLLAAMKAAGIEVVGDRNCSMCGYPLCYFRQGDLLFFDPGCDCTGRRGLEPRSWQGAADWINMQTNEGAREQIKAKFGLLATPTPAAPP